MTAEIERKTFQMLMGVSCCVLRSPSHARRMSLLQIVLVEQEIPCHRMRAMNLWVLSFRGVTCIVLSLERACLSDRADKVLILICNAMLLTWTIVTREASE